jgi:hypothetical protein
LKRKIAPVTTATAAMLAAMPTAIPRRERGSSLTEKTLLPDAAVEAGG